MGSLANFQAPKPNHSKIYRLLGVRRSPGPCVYRRLMLIIHTMDTGYYPEARIHPKAYNKQYDYCILLILYILYTVSY